MTAADLPGAMAQYRAGLDAEMALLQHLQALAVSQRETAQAGDLERLTELTDQRNRVMAGLVAIEHELRPIRQILTSHRTALDNHPEFAGLGERHREAAALVSGIVASDHDSLVALKDAEHARQFAARALEQGESTLAAYRRVVAPPLAGATLVNRKG